MKPLAAPGLDAALDPDALPKPIAGKALKLAAAKGKAPLPGRTAREEGELAFAAALGQLMRPPHEPRVDLPGQEALAGRGPKGRQDNGVNKLTIAGQRPDRPEHVEEALARRAKGHAQDPQAALERRKAAHAHHESPSEERDAKDAPAAATQPFAKTMTDSVKTLTESRETPSPTSAAGVLPPQALADESLRGAVMAQAAHLHLQSEGLGEIGLHLRVREGVAEVRLDGSGAQALKGHESELRQALAAEGVQLGRFTVTAPSASSDASAGSGDMHRDQRPPDQAFADARSSSQHGGEGRRHPSTAAEQREERGPALGPPRAKHTVASEEPRTARRVRTGRHHVDA